MPAANDQPVDVTQNFLDRLFLRLNGYIGKFSECQTRNSTTLASASVNIVQGMMLFNIGTLGFDGSLDIHGLPRQAQQARAIS